MCAATSFTSYPAWFLDKYSLKSPDKYQGLYSNVKPGAIAATAMTAYTTSTRQQGVEVNDHNLSMPSIFLQSQAVPVKSRL